MPTGPKANWTSSRSAQSTPSKRVREMNTLLRAWQVIRRNGETSGSPKTRQATRCFEEKLPQNLRSIQEHLRTGRYAFAPEMGIKRKKGNGKGWRPLVVAPIKDRIVQRAILDVLQTSSEMPGIQNVLETPTSIGGIPDRGVSSAIDLIEAARRNGDAEFVAGSDISGFFTKIDQAVVISFIRGQTSDEEFLDLFRGALKVELENADQMDPDDLRFFPTSDIGVAQGCPLSALAGNIVLHDFDVAMNERGVTCIRYIDDFILLGRKKSAVERAFRSATARLARLGMATYSPTAHPGKAFIGAFNSEFEFLGYKLIPGIYPPAEKSQRKIVESVRNELGRGRAEILRVLNKDHDRKPHECYAQTLVAVDRIVRAWSGSFSACRCLKTAESIDDAINRLIGGFITFYRKKTKKCPVAERRRALGVHLVADDIRQREIPGKPSIKGCLSKPSDPRGPSQATGCSKLSRSSVDRASRSTCLR